LDLVNAPANRDVTTAVYYQGAKILDTSLRFSDPERDGQCEALTVDISDLVPEKCVNSTIAFTESCPDGSKLKPVPNVWLCKAYPFENYGMTGADGKKTISLPEGTSVNLKYFLSLGYDNDRYEGSKGGGKYNYMSGRIDLEAGTDKTINFTLCPSCCLRPPTGGTGSGGF
jgi:hypothetical protein